MQKLPDGHAIENPVVRNHRRHRRCEKQRHHRPDPPEAFIPYTVTGAFERGILVRTQGDPEALLSAVRHEIWAVDRGVAMTLTGTLTGYLRQFSYAEPRFSLVLLSVFASVGLILVAIGVYSVIAYTVARQTREIGIRMALGAGRRDVLRMVSVMGLRLIAIGAAIGLVASFGATRFIATQLTGVSPHDPLTLVGVVVLMGTGGICGVLLPGAESVEGRSVGGVAHRVTKSDERLTNKRQRRVSGSRNERRGRNARQRSIVVGPERYDRVSIERRRRSPFRLYAQPFHDDPRHAGARFREPRHRRGRPRIEDAFRDRDVSANRSRGWHRSAGDESGRPHR